MCCSCAGFALKSLNISFLLLCVSLFYVGVVLFFCVAFFMASILLMGGLRFLKLVSLLGFRVSLCCAGVVCYVFYGFDFASGVG